MKILVNIIKYIAIIILSICIISISITTILSSTILEKEYVKQKLEDNNFYSKMQELVKSNFENYIYQSGLDEEVLNNICPEEKIKKDINQVISNIYDGEDVKIDTTEIANNLKKNIETSGVKINKTNSEAIEKFVQHICDEYTKTIIHTQYENNIYSTLSKVYEIKPKINTMLVVGIVISIITIILTNIGQASKIIRHIGIGLISSAVFAMVVYVTITTKIDISGIRILNEAFSQSLISVLEDILNRFKEIGTIYVIIGAIFVIIYSIIYANKQETKEQQIKNNRGKRWKN